jgi:CDP-glucose 4,6-dehydratase
VRSITADVRDFSRLKAALLRAKPQLVIHMAAQALVRESYIDPAATYSTNVMGTVNVLEAARSAKSVRVVVIVTSDKCYENREWDRGYREDDAMGGRDPYSSSKGCAELVTAAYGRSFFNGEGSGRRRLALASVRAGNVIGGGDWARHRLVPDIMRAAIKGKPARIRNPNAVRPWQHVLDPLHGYLMLSERLWKEGSRFVGGWNFGPDEGEGIPVGEVAERLVSLWGGGAKWAAEPGPHPHEARYLKLDCSKARSALGWRPRLSLAQGLAWTVDWYRAYQRKADMNASCLDQIRRFEAMTKQ